MVHPKLRYTIKLLKAEFLENLAEGERPTRSNFEMIDVLSAVAYGQVHLGEHKVTKEKVAIKILKKKQMIDKNCTLFQLFLP